MKRSQEDLLSLIQEFISEIEENLDELRIGNYAGELLMDISVASKESNGKKDCKKNELFVLLTQKSQALVIIGFIFTSLSGEVI
jgi:hypothetical protein